jgi:anionic cell wall polymer biosynthesis LytR-Cps2A-Psr (LCP) family protein
LSEGENLLDGEQALEYSRIRKIGNDFERTGRQRTVLMALIDKAKTLSLTQLYSLVKEIAPMITTDMTDAQILGYVVEYAPLLSDLTIVSQRIPADGAYYDANINGNLVLALSERNLETNLQILRDSLAE